MSSANEIWAEFASGAQALHAAEHLRTHRVHFAGAYTPYAIPELEEVLGTKRPRAIPLMTLSAGLGGMAVAYLVIWWTAAVNYPLDVGGRPLNSLPADIPILFETGILCAALTAFLSMLFFSGLPRLDHELEDVEGFARSSIDRYWLGVMGDDVRPDQELESLLLKDGALRVHFRSTRKP